MKSLKSHKLVMKGYDDEAEKKKKNITLKISSSLIDNKFEEKMRK